MRKVIGSSLVVASVVVAAGAPAQTPAAPTVKITPPTPVPTATVKPIQIPRAPSIANARRALEPNGQPDTSLYADGPLSYEVEIVNPTSEPLQTRLLVTSNPDFPEYRAELPPVPVNVPANSRTWVKFTDPQGLISGCYDGRAILRLEAGGEAKVLVVQPECVMAWKSRTPADPYAGLAPDRRVSLTAGKVWFHSVRVVAPVPPRCLSSFEIEATVGNAHGSLEGEAAFYLDQSGPDPRDGADVLRPREERRIRISRSFKGMRKAVLKLQPPASGARAPVISGTTSIETTRACRLKSVHLEAHRPR